MSEATNERRYNDSTRYETKIQLVETDEKIPIQHTVTRASDLAKFMLDLKDERVPTIVCVYLNDEKLCLGHQIFTAVTPAHFDTGALFHYYLLFMASRFIVIANHPSGNASPTDDDLHFMKKLQVDCQTLSFKPLFFDFIITTNRKYWSMTTCDGGGCDCGHQEFIEEYEY